MLREPCMLAASAARNSPPVSERSRSSMTTSRSGSAASARSSGLAATKAPRERRNRAGKRQVARAHTRIGRVVATPAGDAAAAQASPAGASSNSGAPSVSRMPRTVLVAVKTTQSKRIESNRPGSDATSRTDARQLRPARLPISTTRSRRTSRPDVTPMASSTGRSR